MLHELKTEKKYYEKSRNNEKSFEFRKNDRDYKVGDDVILREFEDGKYTGRKSPKLKIIYIFDERDFEYFGIKDGYCIFQLRKMNREVWV